MMTTREWVKEQIRTKVYTWRAIRNFLEAKEVAHVDEIGEYAGLETAELNGLYLWHLREAGMVREVKPDIWMWTA